MANYMFKMFRHVKMHVWYVESHVTDMVLTCNMYRHVPLHGVFWWPRVIDKDFTIFSQNLSCSGVTAGLEVGIDTNINAQVTVGVIVQGSLIPPEVSDFAMYAGSWTTFYLSGLRCLILNSHLLLALSADLAGTLDVNANVAVSLMLHLLPSLSLLNAVTGNSW